MAVSHVYLLAHKELPVFKIGKANSIMGRAGSLGMREFDIAKSMGLRVASSGEANTLERMLHSIFATHKVHPQRIKEAMNQTSGHTEWFSNDCMARLKEFLGHIKDLVPYEEMDVEAIESGAVVQLNFDMPETNHYSLKALVATMPGISMRKFIVMAIGGKMAEVATPQECISGTSKERSIADLYKLPDDAPAWLDPRVMKQLNFDLLEARHCELKALVLTMPSMSVRKFIVMAIEREIANTRCARES